MATASWRARRLDPDRSLGLRLTVAALGAFLVLVPFSLLTLLVEARWAPLRELDHEVAEELHSQALGSPGFVDATQLWTNVFAPMPLRAAMLGLALWLAYRRAPRLAAWVVVTMITGGLVGVVLKLLVGRHRPALLDPVSRAAGYSFPSGHALNATLAAGILLLVFLPYVKRMRWLLWAGALALPLLTGLSRAALGVHWISDVIGGWVLGTAIVAATAAAFATWRSSLGRPHVSMVREGVEPESTDPDSPAVRRTGGA